jgi:hypothetical protein
VTYPLEKNCSNRSSTSMQVTDDENAAPSQPASSNEDPVNDPDEVIEVDDDSASEADECSEAELGMVFKHLLSNAVDTYHRNSYKDSQRTGCHPSMFFSRLHLLSNISTIGEFTFSSVLPPTARVKQMAERFVDTSTRPTPSPPAIFANT